MGVDTAFRCSHRDAAMQPPSADHAWRIGTPIPVQKTRNFLNVGLTLLTWTCLYVAPVANVLGRVPLIPLFLASNSTPDSQAQESG